MKNWLQMMKPTDLGVQRSFLFRLSAAGNGDGDGRALVEGRDGEDDFSKVILFRHCGSFKLVFGGEGRCDVLGILISLIIYINNIQNKFLNFNDTIFK